LNLEPETMLYDNLAQSYDALISWPQRLRREKPFLTRAFKQFRVRRILDTACGTGMHAIAFHDWGYHVVGADISAGMIEKARENAGDRKIEFIQAGFTETEKIGGVFDAVTCLGNSLPHVLSDDELDASLAAMLDCLLPGGVLIIHNNNYDRILGRRERFMPLAQGKRDGREHLFLRFFDFDDELLTFNIVTLAKESGEWRMSADSSTHRALTRDLLVGRLEKAGFEAVEVFGSFAGEPFEKLDSDNLVIVAQKPHDSVSRPAPEPVAAIDRIPICENGEPLVDAASVPGIEVKDPPAFGRKTVIEMLKKAQSMLPEGHHLKLKIIYRSLDRQRELYEGFYERLTKDHPDWPASRIRRELNKYLAPPDAKHPPGHSTGGAVDATIVGPDGEELDMISTIDPDLPPMATLPTYSREITTSAAKNRRMLLDVMLAAGFSNFPGEWWHYSYGESAWAVRTGAPCALYGAANPVEQ
jgi:D-alanyl-D-alanine dipeptidase/SAM-dependent methyltransferase